MPEPEPEVEPAPLPEAEPEPEAEVQTGPVLVTIVLESGYGMVFVDDKKVKTKNSRGEVTLMPGKHQVQVLPNSGSRVQNREIEVLSGEPMVVYFDLSR